MFVSLLKDVGVTKMYVNAGMPQKKKKFHHQNTLLKFSYCSRKPNVSWMSQDMEVTKMYMKIMAPADDAPSD